MPSEGSTHRSRRPDRDDLLADIIEYGTKARAAIGELTADELEADELRYAGVCYWLQNVSEATTQLLKTELDLTEKYSDMPWNRIKGIGNVIRHAYSGVDTQVIWSTITGTALASLMRVADLELGGDGSLKGL
jgi:uncharacterized protein with HEPN domain